MKKISFVAIYWTFALLSLALFVPAASTQVGPFNLGGGGAGWQVNSNGLNFDTNSLGQTNLILNGAFVTGQNWEIDFLGDASFNSFAVGSGANAVGISATLNVLGPNAGQNWEIQSSGQIAFDGQQITSDGNGNLSAQSIILGGNFFIDPFGRGTLFASNLKWDESGNLTANSVSVLGAGQFNGNGAGLSNVVSAPLTSWSFVANPITLGTPYTVLSGSRGFITVSASFLAAGSAPASLLFSNFTRNVAIYVGAFQPASTFSGLTVGTFTIPVDSGDSILFYASGSGTVNLLSSYLWK